MEEKDYHIIELNMIKKNIIDDLRKIDSLACKDCLIEKPLVEIKEIAREYYKNHYPVNVDVWRLVNQPKETMKYKDAFYDQLAFFDVIKYLFSEDRGLIKAFVVGTHTSKSIELPVIHMEVCQVKIYMRYNFHNWTISIDSKHELDIRELPKDPISYEVGDVYCIGFKDEWKFSHYGNSKKQFTILLPSDYIVYTFFYLLNREIGRIMDRLYNKNKDKPEPIIGEVYVPYGGGSPIQIIKRLHGMTGYIDSTYTSNGTPVIEYDVYNIVNDTVSVKRLSLEYIQNNFFKSDCPRIFR